MKHFALALICGLLAPGMMPDTAQATESIPRPEHPRPDFFRPDWLTLNGPWQFEIDEKGDGEARGLTSGKDLASKIIVPFCPESKLSGLAHTEIMKNVWYRRMVTVPQSMEGKRILLHFGAVDYKTWVWLNGKLLGSHTGGSTPFTFEITPFLRQGENEVVVHVFDDTRSGLQPNGKQSPTVSEGCLYTRTTGIWQPVWLEAVGQSYIENVSITPDPDHSRAIIQLAVKDAAPGMQIQAEAFVGGKAVGSESSPALGGTLTLTLKLSEKRLWEPGKPFLYDLKLTLTRNGKPVDAVQSYFGLRTVAIQGRSILINGKRVFQRLILDQGFYPDGIWTAPSDEALKRDIELSMAAGYNGARLHQKVFEPRFLYWADKLGYLVWGEFPNWGINLQPACYAPFIQEWSDVLLRDRSHPAIIGWCPFNETPVEAYELEETIWRLTQAIDPTRPRIDTSGFIHTPNCLEVVDTHDYTQDPEIFGKRWLEYFTGPKTGPNLPSRYLSFAGQSIPGDRGVPFMVSEFGGTFWGKETGWGYGAGPKNLEEFYQRYEKLVSALLDNPYHFGFCYTQLTDVEQEHNGLYFYDRTAKFDVKRLHAITSRQAAYEKAEPPAFDPNGPAAQAERSWQVLIGAAQDGGLCKPYRYATEKPGEGWTTEAFDDGKWKTGQAPFGKDVWSVRTPWATSDIYLRQAFDYDGSKLKEGALFIFHDDDAEVFVNGQQIWAGKGFLTFYKTYPVTEPLRKALRKGRNTLAVHTHQTGGGQFIDLALLAQPASKRKK